MKRLPFDLEPFTKRNTSSGSRVHTEFTDECRGRLYRLFGTESSTSEINGAYLELEQEYVRKFEGFSTASTNDQKLLEFIHNEEHEFVLEYIEYLYNIIWSSDRKAKDLAKIDSRLRRILRECRMLIKVVPDRRTLFKFGRYYPENDGAIVFEIIGSEALLNADSDIQKIGQSHSWKDAVEPYNKAWERYQNDEVDLLLFKHLNSALENVMYKICKKDNDWVGESGHLGACLNAMKDHDFFEPNNELYGEWSQIASGIEDVTEALDEMMGGFEKVGTGIKIGVQKPGGDKHRHGEIPEDYAIMVLHQTAAFLTFAIQRHESMNN